MKLEERTKEEVLELLKTEDPVLAYEKMNSSIGGKFTSDGRKEIRLMEIDGELIGMIFSPSVCTLNLSKFDGTFTIRTDFFKKKPYKCRRSNCQSKGFATQGIDFVSFFHKIQ